MEEQGSILFPSITYANKARFFLKQAGIETKLARIPVAVGYGCGYQLLIAADRLDEAAQICKERNVRMIQPPTEKEDGA